MRSTVRGIRGLERGMKRKEISLSFTLLLSSGPPNFLSSGDYSWSTDYFTNAKQKFVRTCILLPKGLYPKILNVNFGGEGGIPSEFLRIPDSKHAMCWGRWEN